jgi:hypothetical protein
MQCKRAAGPAVIIQLKAPIQGEDGERGTLRKRKLRISANTIYTGDIRWSQ